MGSRRKRNHSRVFITCAGLDKPLRTDSPNFQSARTGVKLQAKCRSAGRSNLISEFGS